MTGTGAHETQVGDSLSGVRSDQCAPGGILALLDAGAALSVIPMPRIGAEPPKEYLAFKWGANPTTKGTLYLTKEGAAKVMADYQRRGVVQCIDLWHSTWDPKARPEDKKAVGQYRLALGEEGLWYRDIQWSPKTAQEIRDGNWLYFSPAVMHDKSGVITQHKNAALVNDPGTINAVPTILSDLRLKRTSPMDKKRMVLDCFAALEAAMRKCQALADTDGAEKEIGNKMTGSLAPVMDMARGHMQAGGYLDDVMMAGKRMAAGEKMLSTLYAEFGEEDPEKLQGKLMAKLDGIAPPAAPALPEGSVVLSKEDATSVSKLLLDGHANRIPTVKRPQVAAMSLAGQVAYLSAAADITPPAAPVREPAPPAPTTDNTRAALDAAPKPASKAGKPTTLADCSPQQRAKVDEYLDLARRYQGTSFNEGAEVQEALALLSAEPVTSEQIRWSPMRDDSGNSFGTLTGGN